MTQLSFLIVCKERGEKIMQKRFSKDPKVRLVSIKDFYEWSDYIGDIEENLLKEGGKPNYGIYYKI